MQVQARLGLADPSLVKALLINGARPTRPEYAYNLDSDINYQGWGMPDLRRVIPSSVAAEPDPARLAAALGCGVASLAAQTGLLAVMVPMGASLGPVLLPAFLLIGAAAMVAGARACRAVTHDERFYAKGVLLSGLCQAVAGLTLLATDDPQWNAIGAVVAVGAVLASGAGLFIAPGMMRLFGSETSPRKPDAPAPEPAPEPGDEPQAPEDEA